MQGKITEEKCHNPRDSWGQRQGLPTVCSSFFYKATQYGGNIYCCIRKLSQALYIIDGGILLALKTNENEIVAGKRDRIKSNSSTSTNGSCHDGSYISCFLT
jgi:hypothetical protein